ncbi:carboxylesterase family protein [Streptomyces sp. NBC_01261]|nr:carboxylesterase family protein [Streptomyces sp. NBC_01261]
MGARVPDWDEDGCLTVNVHVPAGALEDNAARPAFVWWHGGGFTSGSGGWDWYDGGRLAALGDIVVVTANYRVGPWVTCICRRSAPPTSAPRTRPPCSPGCGTTSPPSAATRAR